MEFYVEDGTIRGDKVRLIDFDDPSANDWLAVDQFTVIEHGNNRRPDVVVFVNGLPLGVIELKNPRHRERHAYRRLHGGRLVTIMDESVLNTLTSRPFREYLLDKFILRAVVALPRNTFVNAQGSVKTSVIYLQKKGRVI